MYDLLSYYLLLATYYFIQTTYYSVRLAVVHLRLTKYLIPYVLTCILIDLSMEDSIVDVLYFYFFYFLFLLPFEPLNLLTF